MDKYLSRIIGTEIITEAGNLAGRLSDVVVDPDTGKVLGFLIGVKRNRVITPADVLSWNQRIIIRDHEDIFHLDEIVKIEQFVKNPVPILHNRVRTKAGMDLGRVYDFAVHHQMFVLTKILVAKNLLGLWNYDRKMVAHEHILEISKEQITVKDPLERIPVKAKKERALKPKLRVDAIPS